MCDCVSVERCYYTITNPEEGSQVHPLVSFFLSRRSLELSCVVDLLWVGPRSCVPCEEGLIFWAGLRWRFFARFRRDNHIFDQWFGRGVHLSAWAEPQGLHPAFIEWDLVKKPWLAPVCLTTMAQLKVKWNTGLWTRLSMVVILVSMGTCSSMNDCRGIQYAYKQRGLNFESVPRQPTPGKLGTWKWVLKVFPSMAYFSVRKTGCFGVCRYHSLLSGFINPMSCQALFLKTRSIWWVGSGVLMGHKNWDNFVAFLSREHEDCSEGLYATNANT